MKSELNEKIRKIVSVLYRYEGQMSAHEISKLTGVSYLTVQKYLERLGNEGIVQKWKEITKKKKFKGRSQTIKYTLNYDLIKDFE